MAVRPLSDESSSRIIFPQLVTNPVWAIKPASIVVDVLGRDFEIPASMASDWLEVLMVGENLVLDDIFPGMLSPEDREIIEDALYDATLDLGYMYEICLDIVGQVSARPWWVAIRLIEDARQRWDILGAELLLKNIRADQVTLAAWLDATLMLIVRNLEPKHIPMYFAQLEAPVEDSNSSAVEPEMNRNQFLAMM